jgi:zinc D-Ala-D-Ala carboxypeptidase
MKNFKIPALVFVFAVAALLALATFSARAGRIEQQSQAGQTTQAAGEGATERGLEPTAVVIGHSRAAEAAREAVSEAASLFRQAAERNAALSQSLGWSFGGKQQRGWALYVPLISEMIGHDHAHAHYGEGASEAEFASALAIWQKSAGLTASGVLDGETLSRMVSTWQGSRMKTKGYPTPDQLVTAPASEFYDPARPAELRQVEREAYAAYKRMLAAAAADKSLGLKVTPTGELAPEEKFLKIVSSFRSREHQERLRRQSPNSGRAGLAVNSPHFTGRALDLYVGGEPVTTRDDNRAIQVQTPAYRWLVKNAGKFGFRPYYYEPWHWEYVGESVVANR